MRWTISDRTGFHLVIHRSLACVLVVAAVALGACSTVGDDADGDSEDGADADASVTGRWVLVDADGCVAEHPSEVTFTDDGIYTVVHDGFSLWGGGDYEIEAGQLSVQDQRDAMVPYQLSFEGDDLTLVGEEGDGCTVRYRRS
ncbi:MAG: hypothetical protein ACR2QO_12630 [Acidimicrobiales bacterium]